jgi:hypothetical protein
MIKKWLITAGRPDVVSRSIKVSLVVGSLLTLINHADTIWLHGLDAKILLKVLLTYCVPYGVSTYASVSTVLSQQKA